MSRVRRTISPHAASLRAASTDAEAALWTELRDRRFIGWKFRRQHSIGPYIADFACIAARLVIELDGSQHASAVAYDEQRTALLTAEGWHVVRFWNAEVFTKLDHVLATVEHELRARG
ncbi:MULTISPECIES: endonuclease domain-containing protein [Sphingosinicellaceae]|uniref:endonuclease domain-containing protein n=1 Tax=Sphingosinicellaceae TaxID=2820280 RepID=UPI001C1E7A41|nr:MULTISPECIES: DUF559 domain-containing protein [Polymorphobacter]QYE33857.1 DUF559 domain-containing protein [Polymorphobacter sp. PAMC 29334]UAJ09012.1 DUF559 domain-containing protein [Polymorphobacter megasporae]